jgi:hypothetical protein
LFNRLLRSEATAPNMGNDTEWDNGSDTNGTVPLSAACYPLPTESGSATFRRNRRIATQSLVSTRYDTDDFQSVYKKCQVFVSIWTVTRRTKSSDSTYPCQRC